METDQQNLVPIFGYKEPLKPLKKGYGYHGVLLQSADKKFVQCHICGKLYSELSKHIVRHKISAKEYREKFHLSPMTALISEDIRQKRKETTLAWLRSMSPEEYAAYREKAIRRFIKWRKNYKGEFIQPKITLETKNKRGTCPDQLAAKIHEVKEKLGHTPSLAEFIHATEGQKYKHLIFSTFGSWIKGLKYAGLTPREKSKTSDRVWDEALASEIQELRLWERPMTKDQAITALLEKVNELIRVVNKLQRP